MRALSGSLGRTAIGAGVISVLVAVIAPAPVSARDYGRAGAVFPVTEPDLLATIEARLLAAKASGRIDVMNHELAVRTEAKVRRPDRVAGISDARAWRSWVYDPSITVQADITDNKGNVIVPAGRVVNPLDTVPLRASLVFIDGDDPDQIAWALKSTTQLNAKLILTGGSPFDLMKAAQRRFYFDQGGKLTAKFGIAHVPAVVEQSGRLLRITEIVVDGRHS